MEIINVRDDRECIRILTDANMLDKAVRKPPYNTTNLVFGHKGYYVLCLYREGFENPADNGYELFCIPMVSCPADKAALTLAQIVQLDAMGGGEKELKVFERGELVAN